MCSKKQPKLLTRADLNVLKFNKIKIIDLKHSLRENSVRFKANLRKQDLYNLLKDSLYDNYLNDIDINKLLKIQSITKKWLVNRTIQLKGYAYFNRKLCHNESDPISLETIDEIPNKFFFSYKDELNGLTYGFNILSIFEQIKEGDYLNPYTRNEYDKETILRVKKYGNLLKETKDENKPKEEVDIDYRAFNVFHKFQLLSNIMVDEKWFLELDRRKLIKLYVGIEDIWNFRAGLTPAMKLNYLPENITIFQKVHDVAALKFTKPELQKILLDDFEKLITYPQGDNKNTAIMWILTGLVEVSGEAANNLPQLVQFNAD